MRTLHVSDKKRGAPTRMRPRIEQKTADKRNISHPQPDYGKLAASA
jgi:hypothetical protein